MVEQFLPLLIRDLGLAFDCIEVDIVLQDTSESIVVVLNCSYCFIQHVADIILEVLKRRDEISILIVQDSFQRALTGTKKVSP